MLGKSLKRITAAILAVSMSLNSDFIIHAGMEDEVYRTQEESVSDTGEESPSEELSPVGENNPENTPLKEESSQPAEGSNSVSEEPPVMEGENRNREALTGPEAPEIPAEEESRWKVLGVFACEETGAQFEEELDVSGELKDIASFAAYFEGYEWTGKAYLMDFEVSALSDHSFESGGEKAFGEYYGEEETPVVTFAYVPDESGETRESFALAEENASLRVNCNYEGLDEGLDITTYVRNYLVTILGEDGLYYNDKGQSGTSDKWYLRVTPGGSAAAVNLPVQNYTISILRGTNDGFVRVPGYQTLLIPGVVIGLEPVRETEISLTVPYRKKTRTEVNDTASVLYKQDANRNPLNGAEFTLYADEALSRPVRVFTTAGDNGSFAIATNDEALHDFLPAKDGEEHKTEMFLKETKSPDDYEPRDDVYSFIITRKTVEYLQNDTYVTNIYYYPYIGEKQTDGSYSYSRNKTVFNHLTVTSASVKIIWDDNNNRDYLRPRELRPKLLADGEDTGKTALLYSGNEWMSSINDLPKYKDGKEIRYTWDAAVTEGYTRTVETEGNLTTITDTHVPAKVTIKAVIEWDDNNNQDGLRPETLKVTLSSGDEVTLSEANAWTAAVTNLPKYSEGQEIAYTWTKENIAEYELTGEVKDGTVTTLTNTHTPETTETTVIKIWDDHDNQDGKRPESLTFTLSNGMTTTLDESNQWSATIRDLPKYQDGKEIDYRWNEGAVPEGYSITSIVTEGTTVTFTDSYTPGKVSSGVRIVFDDHDNQDGKRPDAVVAVLKKNGEEKEIHELSEANDWRMIVTDLDQYDHGIENEYTWEEKSVPEGYTSDAKQTENLTVITNTYEPETTEATVKKVWDDNNNQDGKRPSSLKVTLSSGDEVTLSEANAWTAAVTNLPKYKGGQAIEYTWSEAEIEGYELTNTEKEDTITVFTNSHTPEMTSATVQKVWNDNNNQDGLRPETLTVTLSNGSQFELTANNSWTRTVLNLPKYKEGKEIVYTWSEETIKGYELRETTEGSVTTLTNTHTPETTEATVKKVWDDNNNQDGKRPDSVVMNLLKNGEILRTVTLSSAGLCTGTVTGLDKYAKGKEVEYTWEEKVIPEGYVPDHPKKEGTVTTITNRRIRGALIVSKKLLDGLDDDRDKKFEFTVKLGAAISGTYGEIVFEDGKAVVSLKGGESVMAENLPTGISYTVTEKQGPGYELTEKKGDTGVIGETASSASFVNRRITGSLTVVKTWSGGSHEKDNVEVTLYQNGNEIRKVVLNRACDWTNVWTNLPGYDINGNEYEYMVKETKGKIGYTVNYPDGNKVMFHSCGESKKIRILNREQGPEKEENNRRYDEPVIVNDGTVRMIWNDNNNSGSTRPKEVVLYLYADSQYTGIRIDLNDQNGWTNSLANLPEFRADGTLIQYILREDPLTNYGIQITGDLVHGFYVYNTLKSGIPNTRDPFHMAGFAFTTVISLLTAAISGMMLKRFG